MAHNIGIQMKRKKLTKTFISVYDDFKLKKLFGLHDHLAHIWQQATYLTSFYLFLMSSTGCQIVVCDTHLSGVYDVLAASIYIF